jgi:hypothetical protein
VLDFPKYMPETWLEDGISVFEPRKAAQDHRSRVARNESWITRIAAPAMIGLSLAVTTLPVHSAASASTLHSVINARVQHNDRLDDLMAVLRGRAQTLPFAPDLLQRAQQIASRAPGPIDINEWAVALANDVSKFRD